MHEICDGDFEIPSRVFEDLAIYDCDDVEYVAIGGMDRILACVPRGPPTSIVWRGGPNPRSRTWPLAKTKLWRCACVACTSQRRPSSAYAYVRFCELSAYGWCGYILCFLLVQCQVPVHQSIEGPAIRSKSFMRPGIDAEWHSRNSLRAQKARHACVRRRCNSFSQWPLNCSCTPSALNPVARGWRWMHVDPTCTKSSVVSGAVVHQDASSKWRDHPKGAKEFCTV